MNIIMSHALQNHYHHQRSSQSRSSSKTRANLSNMLAQEKPFYKVPKVPTSPVDYTEIKHKDFDIISNETLGSGSFGTVFKGLWRDRIVAIKQFKTKEAIDSFTVEVKQLSCVKHPNIVTLHGHSITRDYAFLIMEYAEWGSLNHLLHENKKQPYDLRHACSWALQTASAVAYLHGIRPKPLMHRDLKPANLLLFSNGKILKICDFGTACTVKTQMTNNTGSASYMAPEVFASSSYLESGDVFSWSIIFWELLARKQPYSTHQYSNVFQILWNVSQLGLRPDELQDCPEIIWNLITRSWHKDPKQRPTMLEIAERMELICSLTGSPNMPPPQQQQQARAHTLATTTAIDNSDAANRFNDGLSRRNYYNSNATSLRRMRCEKLSPRINHQLSETSSISEQNKCIMRKLYLQKKLALLEKRRKEIEQSAECDIKQNREDGLNEYEELKKVTKSKKEELEQRKSRSNINTMNINYRSSSVHNKWRSK